MRQSSRRKLQVLFKNLKDDVRFELEKVRSGRTSDLDLESLSHHIMYKLSPYGKELSKYRFFSKWRDK